MRLWLPAIAPLRSIVNRLWEWWVIKNYTSAGLQWGDAQSYYGIMGPCVGYRSMVNRLIKWQARYERLGFSPVPHDAWVSAGGYGKPFEHLMRIIESD